MWLAFLVEHINAIKMAFPQTSGDRIEAIYRRSRRATLSTSIWVVDTSSSSSWSQYNAMPSAHLSVSEAAPATRSTRRWLLRPHTCEVPGRVPKTTRGGNYTKRQMRRQTKKVRKHRWN